jgi:caffeoyl-CoA O-methyltransferase
MEPIDEQLAARVEAYIEDLFARSDEALEQSLRDLEAAEMPSISVSRLQGKLLQLIARMAGARRILEIGTLAGYSTIWLARALPEGGRIISLEVDPKHAAVARRNMERAGLGGMVEIRIGPAADSMRKLIAKGDSLFDLVFIDADKRSYPEYLELSLALSRPGTVILADNVIRGGRVMADGPTDIDVRGAKAFNQALAANPRLDSVIVPIFRQKLDGMSISLVR